MPSEPQSARAAAAKVIRQDLSGAVGALDDVLKRFASKSSLLGAGGGSSRDLPVGGPFQRSGTGETPSEITGFSAMPTSRAMSQALAAYAAIVADGAA